MRFRPASWALSCVFWLIPVASIAQTQPSTQELAHRVDAHYNQLHSLRAAFREEFDGLGMHRAESGTLFLQKPGKMRWEYTSTPGKLFVLDGKYAWFYSPGDSQVQRIAATQLDDLRSPLRFLLGHTKLESELTALISVPNPQTGLFTLAGVPKGQAKRISKLVLTINQNGQILAIEINELDGARTRFQLTGETTNPSIPSDAFHFAPPTGIPVVDALPPV